MGTAIIVVLVLGLLILGALAAGGIALALGSVKASRKNAAIAGVDVTVPQEWALGHDPEARLHRRIAAAVSALDDTIGQAGVADLELRARLMNDAADLDRTLVSIWSLPRDAKPAALADVEPRVAALESAATQQALNPDVDRPRLGELPTLPPLPDPPGAAPSPAEPEVAQPRPAPRQEPEQPA
ncbi:hypothetical protein [Gordonia phthalatica]|uniref:Uncharacterized protein n=1 Tax=Gordonia phthalatica TaxID=1136941 RepID=A0A0N9NK15_9ACTN|nr:hypothetical protein [Gordonia phthalatica]ALG86011.1 hypothetical protein ACH46_17820 [Gordonia phthalatica]